MNDTQAAERLREIRERYPTRHQKAVFFERDGVRWIRIAGFDASMIIEREATPEDLERFGVETGKEAPGGT